MTRDELKQRVNAAIEANAERIVALGERIRRQPELGFKEVKTAALVADVFREIGLAPKTGLALTGVRADVAGGAGPGPTFAVMGELDGLVVQGHPEADTATGAAHACGHNAQVAGMLGAAIGLTATKAMEHLAGRVAFFAVPAEEGGDLEWRLEQVRAGRLELLGGKCELLRLGHLDDVDLAMMIHTTPRAEDGAVAIPRSNNGRFGKTVRFVGKAAHAGAGALALGATVEIETLPGYLPLTCDTTMASVFKVNAETMFGAGACRDAGHRAGSTDMGDVSQVMPVLHPYMGGARGTGHAADYAIADPHMAYVMPARALAAMVVDLLWDGAGRAREVVATAKPALTRDAYVKFQRDIRKREVYHGTTITAAASPR